MQLLGCFSLLIEEPLFLLLEEERKLMYYKRCAGVILAKKVN